MHARCRFLQVLLTVALLAAPAVAEPGYFRSPDVHDDTVAFTAEDDIWVAPAAGGTARRITSHTGTEYFANFSPDGATIAFTGQYDGNSDVFVVPVAGGEPKRLTWHPGTDEVLGWTPDGDRVLFRSRRDGPHGDWGVYTVPAGGGDVEMLPLGWAARLAVDPASGKWAFNRKQRETRNWKRYRGGTAPHIWVGDPKKNDFKQITDEGAGDAFPMWHDGRVYFVSDQGGTANIWSVKDDGSDRTRHTKFEDWDVRWPAIGPDGVIAFVLGADVHLYDAKDDSTRKVDIDLNSDRVLSRVRYPAAARNLTWFDISPDGDRIVVATRGELFSVPVEDGVTLPVSRGTGAREKGARFSADGKRMVYITDESGEEQIRTIDAWGRGDATVLDTAKDSTWMFPPSFSGDGKWVAYADQHHTLYVVPAEGGKPVKVDQGEQREIRDYTWSPDGRWLAYSKNNRVDYASVYVYDTKEGKIHAVTGPDTDDMSPSWDPEGNYLYFLSYRMTNPVLGTRDWQNVEIKSNRLFAVLLREDVENPFIDQAGMPPADDDDDEDGDDEKGDKDKDKKGKKDEEKGGDDEKKDEDKPKPVEIDLEGLSDRVVALPMKRGRYAAVVAAKGKVFFARLPIRGMAEQPGLFEDEGPSAALMAFDMEKKEAEPFVEGISAYEVNRKGDKIAIMKNPGEIYVVGTGGAPGPALAEGKVDLSNVVVELDPREEWKQIYHEAWRHMRDFYWDAGMGGVDWKAEGDRFATLLPRLSSRGDLSNLIGRLIAELSTSHTYVFGGDPGKRATRWSTGLLGADVERDGDAFKVVRIYRGAAADNVRSPLSEPGVDVKEGEYILAVNHQPFDADRPFLAAFENRAGKEVILTVGAKPGDEEARDVVVTPAGREGDLRYSDWVRKNREYVTEKTGGKIGYIHIPDMWTDGLVEFNTWFYPQLEKEGMVVDCRWNGGGAVSQQILERFRRTIVSFDRSRGGGVTTYPSRTLNGPFVVITNEFAGSDGDIFPAAVQLEKLAPVIGMRSWGGVVGIRGDKPLQDGGLLTQPEFAWWDPIDGWELENRGVVPDIEIQNMPQDLARGVDAQLDRSIEEVLRLHEEEPPVVPEFGPARDRSRDAYKDELKGTN